MEEKKLPEKESLALITLMINKTKDACHDTWITMKFKPMLLGGILCWICCIIIIYTPIKIDLLLTAFSAVFAWLIPGIIMERDYRNAKRGLAQSNV